MQRARGPFAAELDDAFPTAIDPLALSLNENPFPPLPAVRSALIRSIYAVNRYPEFLPERLRGQLLQRIRAINAERRYLAMRLSALGVYTTGAHANFMYLPSRGGPWHEVFAGSGLHVRHYADGGARITVGNRASTRAVVSAIGKATVGPRMR
ncbi:hypothetical protein [Mycobacterium interjectum]|uniref:hypothetical protein n=1 Tax=Mycobacterium interjectum TaxID=33895 RepID=UPI000A0599DD|nr:hypothetical protein [Mycobacterium interjectum]MCV7091238.1 hypothetical protein [Mycobacterium interjectum]